jgi:hypothetical protein
MSHKGRHRTFDDPIPLPRGGKLRTLRDAANYITKLPKAEHDAPEWQASSFTSPGFMMKHTGLAEPWLAGLQGVAIGWTSGRRGRNRHGGGVRVDRANVHRGAIGMMYALGGSTLRSLVLRRKPMRVCRAKPV